MRINQGNWCKTWPSLLKYDPYRTRQVASDQRHHKTWHMSDILFLAQWLNYLPSICASNSGGTIWASYLWSLKVTFNVSHSCNWDPTRKLNHRIIGPKRIWAMVVLCMIQSIPYSEPVICIVYTVPYLNLIYRCGRNRLVLRNIYSNLFTRWFKAF